MWCVQRSVCSSLCHCTLLVALCHRHFESCFPFFRGTSATTPLSKTLPPPPSPKREWAKFCSVPLANQNFSPAPSPPISFGQTNFLRPFALHCFSTSGGGGGASRPFISRHSLRIAACAFTCFLCMLVDTIPASILVINVSDISTWMQQLHSWGAQCVGEADC